MLPSKLLSTRRSNVWTREFRSTTRPHSLGQIFPSPPPQGPFSGPVPHAPLKYSSANQGPRAGIARRRGRKNRQHFRLVMISIQQEPRHPLGKHFQETNRKNDLGPFSLFRTEAGGHSHCEVKKSTLTERHTAHEAQEVSGSGLGLLVNKYAGLIRSLTCSLVSWPPGAAP